MQTIELTLTFIKTKINSYTDICGALSANEDDEDSPTNVLLEKYSARKSELEDLMKYIEGDKKSKKGTRSRKSKVEAEESSDTDTSGEDED